MYRPRHWCIVTCYCLIHGQCVLTYRGMPFRSDGIPRRISSCVGHSGTFRIPFRNERRLPHMPCKSGRQTGLCGPRCTKPRSNASHNPGVGRGVVAIERSVSRWAVSLSCPQCILPGMRRNRPGRQFPVVALNLSRLWFSAEQRDLEFHCPISSTRIILAGK